MSALQREFDRKSLTVVALYMETCDGVPDHAAEFRRQVAKHKLEYPALDAEAGPIEDPTRKRFPWAPHALVVDGKGRILRTYGHIPRMRTLRTDLSWLAETGVFPDRPDDGWREFERGAWVEVRIEGDGRPRSETRVLDRLMRDGVKLKTGGTTATIHRERLDGTNRSYERIELEPQCVTIDGRDLTARVFRATWKRLEMTFTETRWIAAGTTVRRERLETCPDGSRVRTTERLVKRDEPLSLGDWKASCRVVEQTVVWNEGRTEEKLWISEKVPGHVVKHVRTAATGGEKHTRTTTVTRYGLP